VPSDRDALLDSIWWVSECLNLRKILLLNVLKGELGSGQGRRSSLELLSSLSFGSSDLNSLHSQNSLLF
jgi:hypothetical protein